MVVTYDAFGNTGTAQAPFDRGRTATHEVGHWLNLRHIWGDDGDGCSGSDFVGDTPNQAGSNVGTPAFPSVSCSNGPNGDMFMNYMDYVDDAAMFMFTAGQVERMQACLDHDRPNIGFQKSGPGGPTKSKFLDDPITLKFRDDPITIKFRDDPITLKFRDDPITIKFRDDPITLKFSDDQNTLPQLDQGGTFKFIDDVKTPNLDKNPISDGKAPSLDKAPGGDVIGAPVLPVFAGAGGRTPFILATPHHSEAWRESFPEASHIETVLAQYEQAIAEVNAAHEAGRLSPEDREMAERLYAEYQALVAQYRQSRGQG